jgi:hypothetical protein
LEPYADTQNTLSEVTSGMEKVKFQAKTGRNRRRARKKPWRKIRLKIYFGVCDQPIPNADGQRHTGQVRRAYGISCWSTSS